MNSLRDLDEAQSYLTSNKLTERRNALDKLTNLLNDKAVIVHINNKTSCWNELLNDSQNCLRKECDRLTELIAKKGLPKGPDKNMNLALEFMTLVMKTALQEGDDKIDISLFVKYIDGCLRDRQLNMCKDYLLRMLNENVLSNPGCLGHLEAEDFILIFNLLKTELESCDRTESIRTINYNSFSLLIKYGPCSAFPTNFLREQFNFISKLIQSVSQNDLRIQQENVVDVVLNFCKHTAEDNRLSCIKLGEEVFGNLFNLYCSSGQESLLKVNIVEFGLLQMILHHPNGVPKGHPQALASNWCNWNICIKKMYSLIMMEISEYLRHNVKNTLFFIPSKNSTEILESFVLLFVQVSRQLFYDKNILMNYSLVESLETTSQAHKKRKVEASLESFVSEIHETKSWLWVKLVGALLNKHPDLIDKKLFLYLLQCLHSLQLETKDSNSISYIYEAQAVLIDIEKFLDLGHDEEVVNLWKLVGDSTLRAIGLNQNVKETQNLLQKLINRRIINVDCVLQTYTSAVRITEHHLRTLELVLEQIHFSQLQLTQKQDIFNSLLNVHKIKDFASLLKINFANILVILTLKQCPDFESVSEDINAEPYETLTQLYARSSLDSNCLIKTKTANIENNSAIRTFNVDYDILTVLLEKLQLFVESAIEEPEDRILCIVGLLYNILSKLVDYDILQKNQINNHQIIALIKTLLQNERVMPAGKYHSREDQRLKELEKISQILTEIFSMNNSITSIFKGLLRKQFLNELVTTLNFFQSETEEKLQLEHSITKALIETLSAYCLICNSAKPNEFQCRILACLANPDYDFKSDTDFDLSMVFLKKAKLAKPGFLPEDIVGGILDCIRELCVGSYQKYENAKNILLVLKGVIQHLNHIDNDDYKKVAIDLLYPFYLRKSCYGPDIALLILDAINEFHKIDPNSIYSKWHDKEVIKYVPEFLESDFQKVRYRAIEVLVEYFCSFSGVVNLETVHRLEEVFESIYESSRKVFEVNGDLTNERRQDETLFRASSALYTFLSILINCHSWTEEALFALIKLEHNKQLYNILDGALIQKLFILLENHFGSETFMDNFAQTILYKWISMGYHINDFPYRMLRCVDKINLYLKYFDICLPLLLRVDRNDLFAAAKQMNLNERDVFERCCTKIFVSAVTSNIQNLGNDFTRTNVELSYLSYVLGTRLVENLVENIGDLLLNLIGGITDEKALEAVLGEIVLFTSRGISTDEFKICLSYIEGLLCKGETLIGFLSKENAGTIQYIILQLQCKMYITTSVARLKCFHQYTIFIGLILKELTADFELATYFFRDTIYFLINFTKNFVQDRKLSLLVVRYTKHFLQNCLPSYAGKFEKFVLFTVNSLKNFAIEHDHLSSTCIDTLEFLVITNEKALSEVIKKLDAFSLSPKFDKMRNIHNKIKYNNKKMSLEDEISMFLAYDDIATRQDSLIHLKDILAKEKDQIKLLYDKLSEVRRFSEDCEQSLLHNLISKLIKMSCYPNENISQEAIKCLGELGPADLTTIVLEPEKRVLNIKCTPFELLTGNVVALLSQYIVDPDIKVVKAASGALYDLLQFKEGLKVARLSIDFGHGMIDKDFIVPYLSSKKYLSQLRIDMHTLSEVVNDSELWCPSHYIESSEWVTSLVVALLKCFQDKCYLQKLIPLCYVKGKFCEYILPLLIYVMLSLPEGNLSKILSSHINLFFQKHWDLTVSSTAPKNMIAANKKSVKCMLDVINFIRQQPSIFERFSSFSFNYLTMAKAAVFCSAHFSALLYVELWCQEKIAADERCNASLFENGITLFDYIYEFESEETVNVVQQILQSSYKSIGDLDALFGCGISLLLQPENRIEYYKNTGQWESVMNYYTIHPISRTDSQLSNISNLVESFKMNHLFQLPLLCEDLPEETKYECLWRLGQWDLPKKGTNKPKEVNSSSYEKLKFDCLKALCDKDNYTFTKVRQQLNKSIIDSLKHTSLESSRNLYSVLSQLQSLSEMDDFFNSIESQTFEETISKWTVHDLLIKRSDFQFVEPIIAQRVTIFRELNKQYPSLEKAYFAMVLSFADYAREESSVRVTENAIINIRTTPNLDVLIKYELEFREVQLAWLKGEKLIAQQLLRKLCNTPNISPRLKANCLMLQGTYMAEIYCDRTSILQKFYDSSKIYDKLGTDMTSQDYKNQQDVYDKIATFADGEYQQIKNHIKSDIFQKKLSNLKSCKAMVQKLNVKKTKTTDERKVHIIHERQIKIDENEVNTAFKDKDVLLGLALKYYIKNLHASDVNNIKIFRLMALFLENKSNKLLTQHFDRLMSLIPSYKYITMLPQLVPHLSTNQQDVLGLQISKIIEKCAIDHPHHTLPLLLALVNSNKDQEYTDSKKKVSANERTTAAIALIKKLREIDSLKGIIDKMIQLSNALIELAYYTNKEVSDKQSNVKIPSKLKINKIRNFDIVLVPTVSVPVSKSNRYDSIEGISEFTMSYRKVGGINAPKRIECRSTTGKTHLQLIKGQDDLRQDAVMQQVFTIMTDLLSSNKRTKSLLIRTYKVVPLSMRSGILEWVPNSMPLGEYLTGSSDYEGAHKEFRPQDKTPSQCKVKYQTGVGKSNAEKLQIYTGICKDFHPVFHKFFETHFRQPSVWYERRRAYIHSVATTSMCGYVLGIGDRHVSNILIDKQTAEVVHIDFGIAFEQGKCLPTPETVPFRLSRDIVAGMGVSGIEGLFRKSCEKTMEVLRCNSQTIVTILEVLLYDPLYFWTLSAAEAKKRQSEDDSYKSMTEDAEEENKNVSAERALLRLREKLHGTEEGKLSSVEQQVGTLIRIAMDPANLSRLFYGWQPYL